MHGLTAREHGLEDYEGTRIVRQEKEIENRIA
jgi:hypothetical protein